MNELYELVASTALSIFLNNSHLMVLNGYFAVISNSVWLLSMFYKVNIGSFLFLTLLVGLTDASYSNLRPHISSATNKHNNSYRPSK